MDLSRSNIELERGGPPFFTDARYPLIRLSFACCCAFRNVNCARFLDRSVSSARRRGERRDEKAFFVQFLDNNNNDNDFFYSLIFHYSFSTSWRKKAALSYEFFLRVLELIEAKTITKIP